MGLDISNEPYELLLPGYPKGSDLTILNTAYFNRKKNEDGTWNPDFISITFRDNKLEQKFSTILYEPKYTFYKLKDEYGPLKHNLFFVEKDKVESVTCKYSELTKVIAKLTGNEGFYLDNIQNGNSSMNRKLHLVPEVFMSDMNIENYYRFLFSQSYTNNIFKLHKAYLDIEVDGRYSLKDFPEPGECPINAVSFLDDKSNTSYQFIYNDPRNPLIEPYRINWYKRSQKEKLRKFVIDALGGYKRAKEFRVDDIKYEILFFDDELDMIKAVFDTIHKIAPDILFIWNMAFDLNYIIERIKELGEDPSNIICDPSIFNKFLKFYIDERNKNEFEERGDFAAISDYTIWLDQMIQFASRRKGRGRYASFSLDYIAETIAGVNKLDYSHITNDISMLPYLNFEIFSFYNIIDTLCQRCIETKTSDGDYIFMKCLTNNTVYAKGHRQSVYLTNRFAKDFFANNYIIGNNKNIFNEKPTIKFPGAMVGDPLHNGACCLLNIAGRPVLMVANCVDFD